MATFFGIEIRRAPRPVKKVTPVGHKFVPAENERYLWIQNMGIRSVLDVGAHEGKTAVCFLSLFPDAHIYSFEPIPECFAKLNEKISGNKRCRAFNLAVGENIGVIEFHQSAYSPSSSILPMAKAHEEAFPFTQGGNKVEVNVITLDHFIQENKLENPLAIKIDVQGFEWQVIKGATETLKKTKLLLIETSFVELYKYQKLFADIYNEMIRLGFIYAGSFDQLFDPHNGIPIQQDAIFIKKND